MSSGSTSKGLDTIPEFNRDNYKKWPWTSFIMVAVCIGAIFFIAGSPTQIAKLPRNDLIVPVIFLTLGVILLVPSVTVILYKLITYILDSAGCKCPAGYQDPVKWLKQKHSRKNTPDDEVTLDTFNRTDQVWTVTSLQHTTSFIETSPTSVNIDVDTNLQYVDYNTRKTTDLKQGNNNDGELQRRDASSMKMKQISYAQINPGNKDRDNESREYTQLDVKRMPERTKDSRVPDVTRANAEQMNYRDRNSKRSGSRSPAPRERLVIGEEQTPQSQRQRQSRQLPRVVVGKESSSDPYNSLSKSNKKPISSKWLDVSNEDSPIPSSPKRSSSRSSKSPRSHLSSQPSSPYSPIQSRATSREPSPRDARLKSAWENTIERRRQTLKRQKESQDGGYSSSIQTSSPTPSRDKHLNVRPSGSNRLSPKNSPGKLSRSPNRLSPNMIPSTTQHRDKNTSSRSYSIAGAPVRLSPASSRGSLSSYDSERWRESLSSSFSDHEEIVLGGTDGVNRSSLLFRESNGDIVIGV